MTLPMDEIGFAGRRLEYVHRGRWSRLVLSSATGFTKALLLFFPILAPDTLGVGPLVEATRYARTVDGKLVEQCERDWTRYH